VRRGRFGAMPSGQRQYPHTIAGGDDIAFVGREVLEDLPDLAAKAAAVGRLGEVVDAMNADDAGLDALANVGGGHGGVVIGLDGPLARQVPLGPDALAGDGRLLGEAVLLEAARPALVARRLGAVLLELDAFLLLRHAVIIPG